ncbi:MAG: Gfo/Idh/MocA family oxidoreductase [Candidatus Latescibacteria bacterium]|jgi:predicted dehydrogenase|nr:Gfo/Idh/MocA family oxidoreductase [Candidatus Latescibacterota bacterium]
MSTPIRWGILGTGSIARKFADGLAVLDDADLVAVGSRSQDTADAFADGYAIPSRHATYEALAGDSEVDAIYVATPHALHRENSILCLEAGKAVLCEKPFTINRGEAEEVVAVARERKVFLMEAMWTRFLPIMTQVRAWVSEGAVGDIRVVSADFGFGSRVNPDSRLYKPELGGGALLDVGVYSVSFASMILGGSPSRIAGMAHIGEIPVDEQAGMVLGYESGAIAVLYTSICARTPQHAYILGSEGSIHIHSPFWQGTTATLSRGGKEKTVELPFEGNGYNCEAAEVMRCLREGRTESETMPLDETLSVMGTLDEIRAQWGLKYPME